jgi:thimet oligopeptidase
LRKRLRTSFNSRAYPANDAVLARLLSQRAELATLLGYQYYAEYDLANRMVQTPRRAQAFLDEIAAAARPAATADATRMLARLRKDDPSITSLGAWSTSYAAALIRKEDYAVDPQLIRQYFRYDKVEAGILKLIQDLFQVEMRPWQTPVWHPDVKTFEMVERGQVIGRFYLDMHPRDGKFTHARMSTVRIGIQGRVVPVAILECNFPKGLMEHGDVVTFLHEFGHLIHWLFAGQRPLAAQNFSEIENDVIEAPSQLLEEWVWDYATLKSFATNEAGAPIPEELVARMNAGRRFAEAFGVMSQLGLAAVSLDYYSTDMRGKDLTRAYDASYNRYALAPEPEGVHVQASFGHLTGYAASYYTYQWSKALASDLLSPFRAAGLRDQATARRYREQILAPGGSASMNTLARQFLGREWTVDAYRRELEQGNVAPAAGAE